MPSRYSSNNTTTRYDGKVVYNTVIYPDVPNQDTDIYVNAHRGDRFDLLAFKYYGNVQDWWLIAVANNIGNTGSMYIAPGTQLRIPIEIDTIINDYNKLNNA